MNPAPNLVLVGPMGAGKTSLGKRIATRLSLRFADVDQRLEESAGASVPTLFAVEGEAAFRLRETAMLETLLAADGQVVSTGGGAVLSARNRELMQQRAYVVYLRIGIDGQLRRLARDHSRPLLAGGDRRSKLEELAQLRNPFYEMLADFSFDVDNSTTASAAAVARSLLDALQPRWQRGIAA